MIAPSPRAKARRAPNLVDLTHHVFGPVTVTGKAVSRIHGSSTVAYWLCECVCGVRFEMRGVDLKRGIDRNCDCPAPALSPALALPPPPAEPSPAGEPEVQFTPHPRPPHTVRTLTPGERSRMVEAFRDSGFSSAEAEEMTALGTSGGTPALPI